MQDDPQDRELELKPELEVAGAGELEVEDAPVVPGLPAPRSESEAIVLSSPMSFVGATRRIWRLGANQPWERFTLLPIALVIVWALLVVWYVLAFGVFGVLVIPWRLHRRSQRRQEREAIRLRETIERRQQPL